MSKIEEGNAHIRQAEKSLKTSLLKWRPDYEVAADEYTHAATCFRIIKSYQQCKDCLMKAAECFKQDHIRSYLYSPTRMNRGFHAAKSLEQALIICKEMGNFSEVPKLAHSACSLYQQHGSPESGATVLHKAGKMVEWTQPEQALELFKRAVDIVMGEDNPRQAAEYMSKIARLLVDLQMYDQAADAVRREIGMHQQIDHIPSVGRLAVALVLVQLARGDQVAAEKAFKEWGNYCEAPEVQTLEMLLQAYDNEDADSARQALNSPFIMHMDVEYAKLARGLPLPQQEYAVPPVGIRANAAESYVSPNAATANTNAADATTNASAPPSRNGQQSVETKVKSETETNDDILPSSVIDKEIENVAGKVSDMSLPSREPQTQDEDDYEGGLC